MSVNTNKPCCFNCKHCLTCPTFKEWKDYDWVCPAHKYFTTLQLDLFEFLEQ